MEKTDQTPPINVDFFEDLTGDISTCAEADIEEIGKRIKSLRRQKSLSLGDLSHLTGFEEELLAGIESGAIQPQLGTVIKLSKALESAFGRLVSGVGDRLYSITRRADRRTVRRSTSRKGQKEIYTYHSLAPEVKGRHMEALIVHLAERTDDEPSVHDGEEFIFVTEGEVYLRIGDEEFTLYPGDSAYYLSTTPHVIAATGGEATILAVLYQG